MKFYTKAITYTEKNLGKVPYEDLMNRLTIAKLMDEFIGSLRKAAGGNSRG